MPLAAKSNCKLKRRADFYDYDPSTLPASVAPFFYHSVQSILTAGFDVVSYITKPNAAPNVTPVIVYMYNKQTCDMLTIASFYTTINGITTPKNNSIFIHRAYTDGSFIGVSSVSRSPGASSFKSRPYYKGSGFYDITDINKLHLFNIELNATSNADPIKVSPVGEFGAFQKYDEDVYEYQAKAGILKFDQQTDMYYATFYGAFYMVWALLWPFRQLHIQKTDKKAHDLINKYHAKYGPL